MIAVEGRGNQTEAPRAVMPKFGTSDSVIWGVAIAIAALFAAGQIFTVLAAAPASVAFHREVGQIPWFVGAIERIGWLGIIAGLGAFDAAVLAGFIWLARRHWIGFAFIPPIMYLGSGAIVLWLLLANPLKWVILRG